eukprot:gene2604-3564_t
MNKKQLEGKIYVSPIKHLLNEENVIPLLNNILHQGRIIREFDKHFRTDAKKLVLKQEEKYENEKETKKKS